jgi:hypothetical protein
MAELAKKEALILELLAAIVASIDSGSADVLENINVKKLKELLFFWGSHGISTLKKKTDLVDVRKPKSSTQNTRQPN